MWGRVIFIACLVWILLIAGGWGVRLAHSTGADPVELHYSPTPCNCDTPTPSYTTDTPPPTIPMPLTEAITATAAPLDTATPLPAPSATPAPTKKSSGPSSQPTATIVIVTPTFNAPTLVIALPETGGDLAPQ